MIEERRHWHGVVAPDGTRIPAIQCTYYESHYVEGEDLEIITSEDELRKLLPSRQEDR